MKVRRWSFRHSLDMGGHINSLVQMKTSSSRSPISSTSDLQGGGSGRGSPDLLEVTQATRPPQEEGTRMRASPRKRKRQRTWSGASPLCFQGSDRFVLSTARGWHFLYTPAFECAAFRHGEEASAARVAKSTEKNEMGKKGGQKPSATCLTHFQEEQVALHKKNQRARKRRVWREKASERKKARAKEPKGNQRCRSCSLTLTCPVFVGVHMNNNNTGRKEEFILSVLNRTK